MGQYMVIHFKNGARQVVRPHNYTGSWHDLANCITGGTHKGIEVK